MQIYENKKNAHSRVIKLFGKVILITTSGYKKRTQRFFGNLITTQKTSDENDNETKITKVLDRVVSKREVKDGCSTTYLFGKLISSKDLNAKFIEKYQKYIEGYKHIIVLHANSGETYLFLTYVLDAFLKKNKINDKLLIVATKKYHIDLINLLCPDIPHCYINTIEIFGKNYTNIKGYNFYTVFTGQHFLQVENDIRNNPLNTAHYFYSIIDEFGIKKEELGFRQVKISEDLKNSTMEKAKKIGLNLDKFVFMAPEAYSCEEYDNDFWVDLCNKLQDEGYDVFFNIVEKDTDIIGCSYKTCDLTFSEAFALSKMSKGIVSLRSGLTECLLQTDAPIFSLYTKFRDRFIFKDMQVEYVLSGFGLKKLPNINPEKIFEFNMSEVDGTSVTEKIIKTLNLNQTEKNTLQYEDFLENDAPNIQKIKIFNTTIFEKRKTKLLTERFLFGFKIYTRDEIKKFYSKYKKFFKNYKNIYIINSNIGEAYIIFKYYSKYLNDPSSLFIINKKSHIDIIKSFAPNCNYMYNNSIDLDLFPSSFEEENRKFYVLFNHEYYVNTEKYIRNNDNAHYFLKIQDFFKNNMNIDEPDITNHITIENETENSLYKKIKEINLDINNFVFISPEANSCLNIDDSILTDFNGKLKNAGYDIFYNLISDNHNLKDCKSCSLSLQEAYLLCSKAKYFISARSGLAEFLAECNIPSYIIYSNFKDNISKENRMDVLSVQNGFTLFKLPYKDKINVKELLAHSREDFKHIFDEIAGEICKK